MSRFATGLKQRRVVIAGLVSLAINLVLLGGLVLVDRPPVFRSAAPGQERSFTIAIYRLQTTPSKKSLERVPVQSNARELPRRADRSHPTPAADEVPLSAPTPATTSAGNEHPPPPFAAGASSNADGTQSRVSQALRMMSACSRSLDEQDRANCAAQMAVRRDDDIDVVPAEMRAEQAAADARRAYVLSGAAASQLPGGRVGDRGLSASVHYECSMKIGESASGKLHCPGAHQALALARRLTK